MEYKQTQIDEQEKDYQELVKRNESTIEQITEDREAEIKQIEDKNTENINQVKDMALKSTAELSIRVNKMSEINNEIESLDR